MTDPSPDGARTEPQPATATLHTDPETLTRLCSGRRPDLARYRLTGAEPDRFQMFR